MIETSNAFKIMLPNVNAQHKAESSVKAGTTPSLNENESAVLEFVRGNDFVTRADVEKQLGVSASTASRLLRRMVRIFCVEIRDSRRQNKLVLLGLCA